MSKLPLRFLRARSMLLLLAGLAACGGSGGTTNAPTTPTTPTTPTPPVTNNPVVTTSVSLMNTAFAPPNIQVSPAATVTFTNNDGFAHNVTFSLSSITASGNFTSGSKAIVMPSAAGTYAYSCTLHSGMSGSVKVQ